MRSKSALTALLALALIGTGGAARADGRAFQGIAPPFEYGYTGQICYTGGVGFFGGPCVSSEASFDRVAATGRVRVEVTTETGQAEAFFGVRHTLAVAASDVVYKLVTRLDSASASADLTGGDRVALEYHLVHGCGCAAADGTITVVGSGTSVARTDVETLFPLKRIDGTRDPIPAGVVFADFILTSYAEGGPSGTSHADATFTIKKLGVFTA